MTRLDSRIRLLWAAQSLCVAIVVGVVIGLVDRFVVSLSEWLSIALFALTLVVGLGYATLRYRRWSYEIRDDSLLLERGVFTRVRTVVPFVRIQHVDSSRDPAERLVGLASTVIYTAGSRGADVTIPGLTPSDSNDLQDLLKRLATRADGDDGV